MTLKEQTSILHAGLSVNTITTFSYFCASPCLFNFYALASESRKVIASTIALAVTAAAWLQSFAEYGYTALAERLQLCTNPFGS